MKNPAVVNFDEILKEVGGFGRFQKQSIASLLVAQIFLAFSNFGFVFFGYTPTEFHCIVGPANTTGCVSTCNQYASDDGYISYTIDWDLICSGTYLMRFAQIVHMAGLFVGAFTCGALADRFGRLRILYISLVIMCALSLATIWIPGIYSFCVTTFLLGICCQGAGLTSYTLILETVGGEYRALCGVIEQVFYALGIALSALLAFYITQWRNLAAAFALYGPLAFLCMLPFHIESTRWLLTKPSKQELAIRNLKYIAMTNGIRCRPMDHGDGASKTPLLDSLLGQASSSEPLEVADDDFQLEDQMEPLLVSTSEPKREGFWVIFSHSLLRKWTLIFSICWFSNAAAYYGSTIASGEAFKNRFVSFALSGLIEIPGHCFSPWLMNKYVAPSDLVSVMEIGVAVSILTLVVSNLASTSTQIDLT